MNAEHTQLEIESTDKQQRCALRKREVHGRETARKSREEEAARLGAAVKSDLHHFLEVKEQAETAWNEEKTKMSAELL